MQLRLGLSKIREPFRLSCVQVSKSALFRPAPLSPFKNTPPPILLIWSHQSLLPVPPRDANIYIIFFPETERPLQTLQIPISWLSRNLSTATDGPSAVTLKLCGPEADAGCGLLEVFRDCSAHPVFMV